MDKRKDVSDYNLILEAIHPMWEMPDTWILIAERHLEEEVKAYCKQRRGPEGEPGEPI